MIAMLAHEEEALRLFQQHRDTDRSILAALLDECLQPATYTAELEAVRKAMEES